MTRVRRTRLRPRYFQAPSLCHLSPSRYAHHRPTANGCVGRRGREDSPTGWLPTSSCAPAISVPLSQTHLRLLLGGRHHAERLCCRPRRRIRMSSTHPVRSATRPDQRRTHHWPAPRANRPAAGLVLKLAPFEQLQRHDRLHTRHLENGTETPNEGSSAPPLPSRLTSHFSSPANKRSPQTAVALSLDGEPTRLRGESRVSHQP